MSYSSVILLKKQHGVWGDVSARWNLGWWDGGEEGKQRQQISYNGSVRTR